MENVTPRKGYVVVQEAEIESDISDNSVEMPEPNGPTVSMEEPELVRVAIISGSKSGDEVFLPPYCSMWSIPGSDYYLVREEDIVADISVS